VLVLLIAAAILLGTACVAVVDRVRFIAGGLAAWVVAEILTRL